MTSNSNSNHDNSESLSPSVAADLSTEPATNEAAPTQGCRVVALINPTRHGRFTCAKLVEAGVNLVGIVEAQTKTQGLPLATFRRLVKKQGLTTTASQVAARIAYASLNSKADRRIYDQLFNADWIDGVLSDWTGSVVPCRSYGEPQTVEAIKSLEPDVLVVHSQSWVTKKVRRLAKSGLVLGGHPGITPHYRGSHSSFWALLNHDTSRVGWTAFHVNEGVDCGDVIVQGRLEPTSGDSFMTLNWRGMIEIATALAEAIVEYDRTGKIPATPHRQIPPNSDYGLPGLRQYLTYRRRQKAVR